MIRKFFLFLLSSFVNCLGLREYMASLETEFDETDIFDKYVVGSMGNYLTPAEFKSLTNKILNEFPEIFRKVHVGLTFNNVDMPGFVFAKGLNEQ
jgi:hypothetical protein